MNDAALAVAQARYALKGFLREPRTFVYTLVLPLFLLVILNGIFRGRSSFLRLRVPFAVYYTPAIISYQIMLAGYSSLLIAVTTERERGMLKRLRGTPMPSWIFLARHPRRDDHRVDGAVPGLGASPRRALVLVGAVRPGRQGHRAIHQRGQGGRRDTGDLRADGRAGLAGQPVRDDRAAPRDDITRAAGRTGRAVKPGESQPSERGGARRSR